MNINKKPLFIIDDEDDDLPLQESSLLNIN